MAIDFNGSTSRIDYPSVMNTQGKNVTVVVYANPDDAHSSNLRYIFESQVDADTLNGFLLAQRPGGDGRRVTVVRTGSTTMVDHTADNALIFGTWKPVGASSSLDMLHASTDIYSNGAPINEVLGFSANGASETSSAGRWAIGGRTFDNLRNFNGPLARVAVWEAILTADEHAQLAAGCPPWRIRPWALRFCAELVVSGRDGVSGQPATETAISPADHPRMYGARL